MPETNETNFGQRLRGARVYRGYATLQHAAAALGMDAAEYAAAESSESVPPTKVARLYSDIYGVTMAYLRNGVPSTVVDRNAEANVGAADPRPRSWTLTDRDDVAARLKTLRLCRGYRMTSVAALTFGWPSDLYSEIEGGRRNFSDALILTYAEAYDVPTAYFFSNMVGPA